MPENNQKAPAVLDISKMKLDEGKIFMVRFNNTVPHTTTQRHTPMFSYAFYEFFLNSILDNLVLTLHMKSLMLAVVYLVQKW